MRTYLVDEEKNEMIVDLRKTIIHNRSLIEFELTTLVDNAIVNSERIYIRKLGGSFFSSVDGVVWNKVAKQELPKKILNVDRVFSVYRGFLPSGLSGGSSGELLTKMPGKVVKISVSVGDRVAKGQQLLVLEAMKMENEIKSNMDGVIKNIYVKEGDALQSGVLMIEMEE